MFELIILTVLNTRLGRIDDPKKKEDRSPLAFYKMYPSKEMSDLEADLEALE